MVHSSCADCFCLGNLLASPKEIGPERAIWRRRGEDWLPAVREKKIGPAPERNERESLDTAYYAIIIGPGRILRIHETPG